MGRELEQLLRVQCISSTEEELFDTGYRLLELFSHCFCEEEKIMWRYSYSNRVEHKKAHDHYQKKLYSIDRLIFKTNPNKGIEDLKSIITEWTLEHMLTEDKTMGDEIGGSIHG